MNLQTFIEEHIDAVSRAGHARPRLLLRQLVAHRLDIDEAAVFAHPERELTKGELRGLARDAAALAAGRPLAYIYGESPFLDWTFLTDERALMPRPETEELVRRVIAGYRGRPAPTDIVDLCTGSGVMGLALALSFPRARVTLTDLSQEALDLCRENAALHGVADRVSIQSGDLWDAVAPEARFDLAVANPPYVAAGDQVAASVTSHEPDLALHGGADGAAHLRALLRQLPHRLTPGGRAAFETGHAHERTLQSWLVSRFEDRFRWERDPFGVARYLFVENKD